MISFSESAPRGPSKEQVVAVLKDINTSPKEAQELYMQWIDEKQKEMDESQSEYSRLKYNIDVAELLFEANLIEDALIYCESAWEIVSNEIQDLDPSRISNELLDLCTRLDIISDEIL
ncbi:MAG: hypothetical protein V4686_00900 [Patescibacteria group bacterium]